MVDLTDLQDVAARVERATIAIDLSSAKLRDELAQIGRIAAAVRGLAAQTQMLALNAEIEAARAGDAGSGFAVVANEVKSLAKAGTFAVAEIDTRTLGAVEAAEQNAMAVAALQDAVTHGLAVVAGLVGKA